MQPTNEMVHNFFRGSNLEELRQKYFAPSGQYDVLNAFFVALITNDQEGIAKLGEQIQSNELYRNIDIDKTLLNFNCLSREELERLDEQDMKTSINEAGLLSDDD